MKTRSSDGSMPIPGYLVSVYDTTSGTAQRIARKKITEGPGLEDDRTLLDHQYGPLEWDRIRVRRKTDKDFNVVFRSQTGIAPGANMAHSEHHCAPGKNAELHSATGSTFRVVIQTLPESEWKVGEALKFLPPRATITAEAGGWRITFEPRQYPCVLTVAPDDGTKNEAFPSFPFPSNPRLTSCSYVIPYRNNFSFFQGGLVRLGVRGAGLMVKVALPAMGQTTEIKPAHFKVEGAAQPHLMTEDYVVEKYTQWAGYIQYA